MMKFNQVLVAGIMAVGAVAAVAAGILLWFVVTQPVAAAALVGGGR